MLRNEAEAREAQARMTEARMAEARIADAEMTEAREAERRIVNRLQRHSLSLSPHHRHDDLKPSDSSSLSVRLNHFFPVRRGRGQPRGSRGGRNQRGGGTQGQHTQVIQQRGRRGQAIRQHRLPTTELASISHILSHENNMPSMHSLGARSV